MPFAALFATVAQLALRPAHSTHKFILSLLIVLLASGRVEPPSAIAAPAPPPLQLGQTPPPKEQADELLRQGAKAFQQRQWEAAETAWQQALQLYRQVGDRGGEGRILGNLAAIQEALGNNSKALELFQASLAIARERRDPRGESFALANLAYVYKNLGDYAQALKYLNQALPLTRQTQDREGEFETLNQMGILQRSLGNYDAAIALLQQSMALAKQLGQDLGVANSLGNLANTYTEQGNYPAALSHYQAALTLMQKINHSVGEAGVLQRLGSLYQQLGNVPRAIQYYTQSLTLARKLGDRRLEAYNLGNLGKAYYNSNRPKEGLEVLQQALSIMQQLGDRASEGKLLHSIGNAYTDLRQYKIAQQYYEQGLAISRQIGDRPGEGQSLGALAILLDITRQREPAIARYREAVAILRSVGDRPSEGKALSNLGMALYDAGQLEAAAKTLFAAIAIWESLRPGLSDADQVSLFETQADTYRVLQQVLIKLNRSNEALEISERGRARAFLELVAQRLSSQAAKRFQTPPPTLSEIRRIAQQQQATLVQYSILNNAEVGIWVIAPSGQIHFRKTVLTETDIPIEQLAEDTRVAAVLGRGSGSASTGMTQLVSETRAALETETQPAQAEPVRRRLNRKLRNMHQILIEPIADLLPKNPEDHVIFIPQGTLLLVPFAALQEADKTFLIERHTIRTAPSIQVLDLTQTQQAQRPSQPQAAATNALVIGNPTMPKLGDPPEPLTDLPFAEKEAIAIAALLKTTALTGANATENTVTRQMAEARLIHFATHGLLDDFAGLGVPGALALAPTGNTDGFLTASEILDLSLKRSDLVVLSACDTGRGRVTGDGVIGLSRSFIAAGAPSIVVSLWAVPDDATALLMTSFYQTLQHTPDKAKALRQAMLATLQRYPNARDWAAFTLIGEAQ